jgi:hypothetical protein
MSIKAMNHVWGNSKANGAGLLALLAIADCADDNGIAYPSQTTIARKARISDRNLRRVIYELCEIGEMTVLEKGDGRRSARYQILMKSNEGGQIDHPKKTQNANFEGGQDVHPKNEGGQSDHPGRTQLRPPRADTAMSTEQSYNSHVIKEYPLTPSSLFPETQGAPSKNSEPPPPFEAATAAKKNDDSDRSAPSIIENTDKSSSDGLRASSTRTESTPYGFNSEGQILLGKEDVLNRLLRLFHRPFNEPLSEIESKAFDQLGRVTSHDLKTIEEWMEMSAPDDALKHRPETFLSMVRNWGRNRDRAFERVRRFGKPKQSKKSPENQHSFESRFSKIPDLVPNSKADAENEFQTVIKNLRMLMPESGTKAIKNQADPVGLRAEDKALVLKAKSTFAASFLSENYHRQIEAAANPRKVLICV